MQIVAPAFDFKPSAQSVQAAELVWAVAAENLPAAQFVQKGEASAAEYVPAAQLSHAALPVVALYVPAAQAVQLPAGPVYPASHLHAEFEELPAGEVEFDGHAVQVLSLVCAVDAEYFPAAQAVHAAEPAIDLYVPAAQASHVEVPV